MIYQDLHNHTQWSDGSSTPEELLHRARKNGLKVLGISNHYEVIQDKVAYRRTLNKLKKYFPDIKFLIGVEIRIGTLLSLPIVDLDTLNLYDYILIENLEYHTNIPEVLEYLSSIRSKLTAKIGLAHLDLERLGSHRIGVIDFMVAQNIFLDFNFEGTFYANLLQGYGQIEDILGSGIEIIVGSDTHAIETDWWHNLISAHNYLIKHNHLLTPRTSKLTPTKSIYKTNKVFEH